MDLDHSYSYERFQNGNRRSMKQYDNTVKSCKAQKNYQDRMPEFRMNSKQCQYSAHRNYQNEFKNQDFKQMHHFTRPSVSTAVTSVATEDYTIDNSQDGSIYVSRLIYSGDRSMKFGEDTSVSSESNAMYDTRSLASHSTIFYDAYSNYSNYLHEYHPVSPPYGMPPRGYYSRCATANHYRYYSEDSLASSHYTYGSYMPQEYQKWKSYSPNKSSRILLEEAKPFWSRLKSLFVGESQTCNQTGIFGTCFEAVKSPSTPDSHIKAYHEDEEKEHRYHSFKDIDRTCALKSHGDRNAKQNAITIKKTNSTRELNDYSFVNLGKTPDLRSNKQDRSNFHNKTESDVYHPSMDNDFYHCDKSLILSPPKKETSKRRLFQTPAKGWIENQESPYSIQSEQSPMNNTNCRFEYSTSETDSYVADADTIFSGNHTDADTLDLHGITPRSDAESSSSVSSPQSNCSEYKMASSLINEHLVTSPQRIYNKPPLRPSRCAETKDKSPTISPMNTIATNGTLHRRMKSTLTIDSLAQIFRDDEQSFLSPVQSKISKVIPKTVKTVKKNRYDKNEGDGISPLDDDGEDSKTGFQNRLQDVDVAVEDDSVCSPVYGTSKTSFDFSQKLTSVDLFGKENIEVGQFGLARNEPQSISREVGSVKENYSSVLQKEPEGTYLPISNVFQNEIYKDKNGYSDVVLQGWVAYSKGPKAKDEFLDGLRHKNKIKRKHLRYIVIHEDFMHVFSSKKAQQDSDNESFYSDTKQFAKKLKLSKHIMVEVQDVSKNHGHCIILKDKRLKGVRNSDIVCTLLPVRLDPSFFVDDNYSQLVESKVFEIQRSSLFATIPEVGNSNERPFILKEQQIASSKTPYPDHKAQITRQNEWPITALETVPFEQHTAALHLQFALDAAKWYNNYHNAC